MANHAKLLKKLRRISRRHTAPGAPPGSIVVDPQAPQPVIRVIGYGPEKFIEYPVDQPAQLREFLARWPVCWINVDGLGDAATLQTVASIVGMHPLALEDVVNVHQRSKVELYGDQTFIVTHMIRYCGHLETEQVSLYLGANFVVTFQQEAEWDAFEPVRERIRKEVSQLRKRGAGYLAYTLLDSVIDHHFPVLEIYGDRLEELEDRILLEPDRSLVEQVHAVKRELLHLRRIVWPQREALNSLIRDEIPHVDDETRIYLRDCYDHALRIIDLLETDREVCSDLMDLYLSSVSHRMNEVMKVLTIIATLFIPLTFVAGVYGMNFDPAKSPWNMPELEWYWGYPACMALMVAISLGQLVFFWRRGWIGRRARKQDVNNETASPVPGAPRTNGRTQGPDGRR